MQAKLNGKREGGEISKVHISVGKKKDFLFLSNNVDCILPFFSSKLGLERFHSVAILGFNSAEWFISAVGAVFAGGIVSGIYTTSSPEACHYIAHDCRANIVVVENQKQLDKIMQIWDRLPYLKAVVMYKDRVSEKHPNLYTMDEFMELGNEIPDGQLDAIINSQEANQCCVLIYTSGTTGKSKGVMLSHDNDAEDSQVRGLGRESVVAGETDWPWAQRKSCHRVWALSRKAGERIRLAVVRGSLVVPRERNVFYSKDLQSWQLLR
uniref:Long-chain-fatty-acid--CoA ligase ACSBG1 n=1 Tax=Naja naja TaxID=35670 RepID=A0A8C6VPT1_NAJNA